MTDKFEKGDLVWGGSPRAVLERRIDEIGVVLSVTPSGRKAVGMQDFVEVYWTKDGYKGFHIPEWLKRVSK